MVAHWPGMSDNVGLSPAPGTVFPIFITPTTLSCHRLTIFPLTICPKRMDVNRGAYINVSFYLFTLQFADCILEQQQPEVNSQRSPK